MDATVQAIIVTGAITILGPLLHEWAKQRMAAVNEDRKRARDEVALQKQCLMELIEAHKTLTAIALHRKGFGDLGSEESSEWIAAMRYWENAFDRAFKTGLVKVNEANTELRIEVNVWLRKLLDETRESEFEIGRFVPESMREPVAARIGELNARLVNEIESIGQSRKPKWHNVLPGRKPPASGASALP